MGLARARRAGRRRGHADQGGAQPAAELKARPVVDLGDARLEALPGLGPPGGRGRVRERHQGERAQKESRLFHPRLVRVLSGIAPESLAFQWKYPRHGSLFIPQGDAVRFEPTLRAGRGAGTMSTGN